MKGDLADVELVTAATVAEACGRLEQGYRPLCGGTDVMVLLAAGKLPQPRWVDVSRLAELRGIAVDDAAVTFGAATTYTEVRRHPVVARELPMLAQAASETGGIAIQNRGTLGGNVANASPAADSAPALLAYGAEVVLASRAGTRRLPYEDFHIAYRRTAALPGELITHLVVPRAAGRAHFYRKVGPRRAQAISKVCFAGCVERDGEGGRPVRVRIALGGVAPVPVRARDCERALLAGEGLEAATRALAIAVKPIDDVRSTARYRSRVAENLLRDFVAHVGLGR